jgi:hypothetical protein
MANHDLLPDASRPRPDADLARVHLGLDWETIFIRSGDPDGLGRIFAWLMAQIQDARGPR